MIKFDTIAHYQFSFFSPNSRVEPSPKIISSFMKAFDGTDFMPNTISELHIASEPEAQLRLQLQLITADSAWAIGFEPHRILFAKKHIPDSKIGSLEDPDSKIGSPEDFSADVFNFCTRVLSVLNIQGTRLAFVTKGFLPEMEDTMINSIYTKVLIPPYFYLKHESTEWATRNVASLNTDNFASPERYNVITDINRVRLVSTENGVSKESSRIEIGFDINTNQKDKLPRFGASDVEVFMSEVIKIRHQISSEIEESIL